MPSKSAIRIGILKIAGWSCFCLLLAAPASAKPVANAGPDQDVFEKTVVTLDGSGSYDTNNIPFGWRWIQNGGIPVALDNPFIAKPKFTAPSLENINQITFELTITNWFGQTDIDSVKIKVHPYAKPVSNAGPDQTVPGGALVTLNGSGSYHPNGLQITYAWVQKSGPAVQLENANTAFPKFVAPVNPDQQKLEFRLTIQDTEGQTTFDDVSVTVEGSNQPPVASAGPNQSVLVGVTVFLTASDSVDPDGDIMSFKWTQLAGPPVTINTPNQVKASFTAPSNPTQLEFRVTVTDIWGAASSDEVAIAVSTAPNKPPTANAGPDKTATEGSDVTFTGSGSDDDGDALTFAWNQKSGPPALLGSTNTAVLNVKAPSVESDTNLEFRLVVSDGKSSAEDVVTLHVTNGTGSAGPAPTFVIDEFRAAPNPFNPGLRNASFLYVLGSNSDVYISIFDVYGNHVIELDSAAGSIGGQKGENSLSWNGRNGNGDVVTTGIYIAHVRVEGQGQKSESKYKIAVVRP